MGLKFMLSTALAILVLAVFASAQLGLEGEATVNIGGSEVNSDLEVGTNAGGESTATLSSGSLVVITITPAEARSRAAASFNQENCDDCEVELTESNVDGNAHAVYRVETEKRVKIFRLFNADMDVSADVDAQTGAVLRVDEPFWAFLASETSANAQAQGNSQING